MELNLQIPKIVELDLSGEQVDSPFPLIQPLKELLNEHLVYLDTHHDYSFEGLLFGDSLGARMWDRTVKEILSMQLPEVSGEGSVEDYLRGVMPRPGESAVELEDEITDLIANALKERNIVLFNYKETHGPGERFRFFDCSWSPGNPFTIDEYGRLGLKTDNAGNRGYAVVPFLPESYSQSVSDLFNGSNITSSEICLKSTPFLVKDTSEHCGEKIYTTNTIYAVISDDHYVNIEQLLSYIGVPNDPDDNLSLFDNDGNEWDFDVTSVSYIYTSPVPPDCSLMQTKSQAKELYPDFFPPKGLEATKKNKIIAR